jgi:glycine dehydrogenase subunit 1
MDDLAAVAVQSPNFFGRVEDLSGVGQTAERLGAVFVSSFTEPLAYGLYKNPGSCGAEIVCGEGQSLGLPMSFGGPGLGILATKMKCVRSLPGRLVGETKDLDGRRGFVLTLATREQHIRREKAVSNICTNASHCALTAAAYMASLGKTGFQELAALNHDKAEYLRGELVKAGGQDVFPGPIFNEFVIRFPQAEALRRRLLDKKKVLGLPLGRYYPELADCLLVCATETKSKKDMDELVEEVQS